MKRNVVKCTHCGREISKSNLARHEQSCSGKKDKVSYKLNHDGLICQFCGKECKNRNSLCNHERLCKMNPNRQFANGIVGFNNSGRPAWNKGLTAKIDERVRRQSESLRDWYSENPNHEHGGYIPTSARNVKYGTYKGYFCDSSWELAFLIYQLDHNANIRRCTEYFTYSFDNKLHRYYPDFIIDNIYYEIKGRYTKRDYIKIEQFPKDKQLYVIDKTNIYKYISYCKANYGINFAELYDSTLPSWLNGGRRYIKDDQ